jgi:hypothetical protein
MDVDARLRKLQSKYRRALSGAVAAKARYLSLSDGEHTQAAREIARRHWRRMDALKLLLTERMRPLQFAQRESTQLHSVQFQSAERRSEPSHGQAVFHFV